MKIKGILALAFSLLLLFSVQCVSVLAESPADITEKEDTVMLMGTWNSFEGAEMIAENDSDFSLTLKLDADSYQFAIDKNGTELSNPATVRDTTVTTSSHGLIFSETINARCTLLATGGNYTFEYNAENDLLSITKEGYAKPSDTGENLKLCIGDKVITANTGEKINYSVYLKADKAFEDIQAALSFNSSKLELTKTTDAEADALKACPNLKEVSYNPQLDGLVAVNSSNVEGYDFTEEKLLLTLEFTVIGTGETHLEFTVQDMTILGGNESYYFLSSEKTEGAVIREIAEIQAVAEPTTSTEPIITNPTEPTEASSSVLSTDPTTDATNIPATSTDPTEASSSVLSPEFDLGDVNRDSKLNIRDATLIQKFLAKLSDLDDEQLKLADYNTDEKVNIKDATQIQKKLANLI